MIETFLQQQSLYFPNAESPTDHKRHYLVQPMNPANPLLGIMGQEADVAKLCRLAYQAIGQGRRI